MRGSFLFYPHEDDEAGGTTLVLSLRDPSPQQGPRNRGVLTVLSGLESGRVIPIDAGLPVTLGRSVECTVGFADQGLSRVHAQITVQGQLFMLSDRGSRNGTLVNGQRVEQQVPLRDGDRVTLGVETSLRFSLVSAAEEAALCRTYAEATLDGLTGLFNRKQLDTRLAFFVESARRDGQSLSVAMVDIDHFKQVNDTHGHLAGDEVLKGAATTLKLGSRSGDLVARYGGEEFALVARNTDALTLGLLADGLRCAVKEREFRATSRVIRVTCSVGIASLDECAEPTSAGLLGLADRRLYAAKKGGRDRVVGP